MVRVTENALFFFQSLARNIDWLLFSSAVLISLAGLVTMNSFVGESPFVSRQIVWIALAIAVFFACSLVDFRFLRRTGVMVGLFVAICSILLLLFGLGQVTRGVQSWFNFGLFSFQPSDPAKIILILLLSKYFSRRHVEIAHIRHILVSGFYSIILFTLVLLQPDFGSAIVIFMIWFGMIMVSGISKKHLLAVFCAGLIAVLLLWSFVFQDYQKQRILSFVYPLADIQGAGYNAYQSMVAVGSGELLGKGIGYGTQSKLLFLPEFQTDFIFAAFAEEWGFIGTALLMFFYGVVLWRILHAGMYAESNFEKLFAAGIALLLFFQSSIHFGMNIGVFPITGLGLPMVSYGGSSLITTFFALGILESFSIHRHRRGVFLGVEERYQEGIVGA